MNILVTGSAGMIGGYRQYYLLMFGVIIVYFITCYKCLGRNAEVLRVRVKWR